MEPVWQVQAGWQSPQAGQRVRSVQPQPQQVCWQAQPIQQRQLLLPPVSAIVLPVAFGEPEQPQRVRWQSPQAR